MADPTWRAQLRTILTQRIGTPIPVAELFAAVGEQIPLHIASRKWLGKHSELATPDRMRFRTLVMALNNLDVEFDPPANDARHPVMRESMVIAHAATCANCGGAFVADRPRSQLNCSLACASVARERKFRSKKLPLTKDYAPALEELAKLADQVRERV